MTGCATVPTPDAAAGPTAVLAHPVFVPGPSRTVYQSDIGPVVRERSAVDDTGAWTSRTTGPGEDVTVGLRALTDGSVQITAIRSGDRVVECLPGLTVQPVSLALPWTASAPCTVDGRQGTASASLTPAPDLGPGWTRLDLRFEAGAVTITRRFDWLQDIDGAVTEEHARLRVTFLGLTVRDWSRGMRLTASRAGPGP